MAISGALAPLIFLSSFGRSYPALGDALAFIVPIGVAGLFGLFNGWFITRFQVRPIAGTLVMFIAGRGIGQALTNGNLQVFKILAFRFIGLGRIFGVPCQVVIMLALVAVAAWTLRSTLFGRQIVSVGGNERAARLMGLPVDRVKFLTYVRSGMFSGLAGVILAAQFGTGQPAKGVGWGIVLDRRGRRRRNAAHRRRGFSGDDARRRAFAPPHLQRVQLRERARLDQPQRLLAAGGARRVSDGGGDGEFRSRAPRHRAAYPRTPVPCGARSTIRRAPT